MNDERPVFIVGCGQRSGSSALGRALSATSRLHIFGDNNHVVEMLYEAWRRIMRVPAASSLPRPIKCYQAPDGPANDLAAGAAGRGWLEAFYRSSTDALGKARWGFEDDRCTARQARYLLEAFPDGRVLFVLRDPAEVVTSPQTLREWRARTELYFAWGDKRSLIVRAERLTDPRELTAIALHVDVERDEIETAALALTTETNGMSLSTRLAAHGFENRQAIVQAGYPDPMTDPRYSLLRLSQSGPGGRMPT